MSQDLPRARPRDVASHSGFTIIELTITIALSSIVSAVVLNIGIETMKFTSYADEDFVAQGEANRGFDRVSEALRKTGWNTSASSTTYPRVINGGDEIQFRVLTDLDGNGYEFDAATGDLEWNAEVFSIRREEDGTLAIFDADGDRVWTCARSISDVTFSTSVEDPALHFREIRVQITGSRATSDGTTLTSTASGSVHMRN